MGAFSSKSSKSISNASSSKKVEVTAVDRAILDLKNSRDRLQRYRTKLQQDDKKLLEQVVKAKQMNQTSTAIGLLRLRKFKQQQMQSCEDQLLTVLQMVETIDSKRNDSVLLQAMASGKDALKKLHEETTVDDILQLMEQISDEHSVEEEVSNILRQNVPLLSSSEEDELEQELANMMIISSEANIQQQQQQQEKYDSTSTTSTTTTTTTTTVQPNKEVVEENILLPVAPTDKLLPTAPTTSIETKISSDDIQKVSSNTTDPVALPS